MRGVTTDENTPFLKLLRHQRVPGNPGSHRQHLGGNFSAQSLRKDPARIIGRPALSVLALVHGGMESELGFAVHRCHEGTALRIDRHIHPGARVRDHVVKRGRTQVHRKHLAAHELAFDAAATTPCNAQLVAHQAAWAVGPNEVPGVDGDRFATCGGAHPGVDLRAGIFKGFQCPAIAHVYTG